MVWVIEVLELTYGNRLPSGQLDGLGMFTLCATAVDEAGSQPIPGCNHSHHTRQSAEECTEANLAIAHLTGRKAPNLSAPREWVHVYKDEGGNTRSEVVGGMKPKKREGTLLIGLVPLQ